MAVWLMVHEILLKDGIVALLRSAILVETMLTTRFIDPGWGRILGDNTTPMGPENRIGPHRLPTSDPSGI